MIALHLLFLLMGLIVLILNKAIVLISGKVVPRYIIYIGNKKALITQAMRGKVYLIKNLKGNEANFKAFLFKENLRKSGQSYEIITYGDEDIVCKV